MSKVLFISQNGDLLPLAERVELEGHGVTLHICNSFYTSRGRGNVKARSATSVGLLQEENVVNQKNIEDLLQKVSPDICVTDGGMGRVGEVVRRMGVQTWGSDRWSELVFGEYERNLLKSINVKPLPQPTPGDASFGVGAFSDGDILYNPFLAVTEVGLQNKGVGVQGDGGVCVQALHAGHPLLKELYKLEEVIKRVSYKGMLLLSSHLEVGFSLPLFACMYELTKGKLLDVLKGRKDDVTKEWASATRISLPPFPIPSDIRYVKHVSVVKGAAKHIWFVDASNSDIGICDGNVGWVSARGGEQEKEEFTPLREARRRTLRTITNMKNENDLKELQYRTDVGVRSAQILATYEVSNHVKERTYISPGKPLPVEKKKEGKKGDGYNE